MSALPKDTLTDLAMPATSSVDNHEFLKLLPALKKHASIRFRHLNRTDREEAIAEATAAAFVNFKTAATAGTSHRITPGTLAHYAVLHVATGRRAGGGGNGKTDVMSAAAQRRGGFRIFALPWNDARLDCMVASEREVWRLHLLHDHRTPPADQAAFRIDWSNFLAGQHERTRQALALLGEGDTQVEVADNRRQPE